MFDTYEEHLAHSAACSSRWDGFDRGDYDRSTVIGRMTNSAGRKVTITMFYNTGEENAEYVVAVDGAEVFRTGWKNAAINEGRYYYRHAK